MGTGRHSILLQLNGIPLCPPSVCSLWLPPLSLQPIRRQWWHHCRRCTRCWRSTRRRRPATVPTAALALFLLSTSCTTCMRRWGPAPASCHGTVAVRGSRTSRAAALLRWCMFHDIEESDRYMTTCRPLLHPEASWILRFSVTLSLWLQMEPPLSGLQSGSLTTTLHLKFRCPALSCPSRGTVSQAGVVASDGERATRSRS